MSIDAGKGGIQRSLEVNTDLVAGNKNAAEEIVGQIAVASPVRAGVDTRRQ